MRLTSIVVAALLSALTPAGADEVLIQDRIGLTIGRLATAPDGSLRIQDRVGLTRGYISGRCRMASGGPGQEAPNVTSKGAWSQHAGARRRSAASPAWHPAHGIGMNGPVIGMAAGCLAALRLPPRKLGVRRRSAAAGGAPQDDIATSGRTVHDFDAGAPVARGARRVEGIEQRIAAREVGAVVIGTHPHRPAMAVPRQSILLRRCGGRLCSGFNQLSAPAVPMRVPRRATWQGWRIMIDAQTATAQTPGFRGVG